MPGINRIYLVVARPRANGVDIAAVGLDLRVHLRVAVDLRGRGHQHPGPDPVREPEHVDGADRVGLDRLDRIVPEDRSWECHRAAE